jgi:hypothetical protein
MRWALRRRDGKLAVYGDARPVARIIGGLVILAICAIILYTQMRTLVEDPRPQAAVRAGALLVAAILGCLLIVRPCLTRSELHLDGGQHTLTLHRWPPWGRARQETLRADEVRHAVLVRKHRGKPYESLYLILADNRTRHLDEGLEQGLMDRLAVDVEAALLGRLIKINTRLDGPRFVKESRSSERIVYLDLRNRERRGAILLAVMMGSVCTVLGVAPPAAVVFTSTPAQAVEALISKLPISALALLWLIVTCTFAFVAFRCAVILLRYLQLVELVIHRDGTGITLRYLSWRNNAFEETWAASDIADVVTEGKLPWTRKRAKRDFECRRVWLRRHNGRRLLLDRTEELLWEASPGLPRDEQSLADFAAALGKDLRVPVNREWLSWFGRWFG